MAGSDKSDGLSFGELSLEPLPDPNLLHFQVVKPTAATADPKAMPRPHGCTDRRSNKERRKTLRMEADRRTGKDRRPRSKGFEPGKIP